MKTTLYCTSRSNAHTDLIVTALHAAGFGPSDFSILGGKSEGGAGESVVSHLVSLGVPEAQAVQYGDQLPPGTYLISIQADTEDLVAAAKRALQATEAGSIRIQEPQEGRI